MSGRVYAQTSPVRTDDPAWSIASEEHAGERRARCWVRREWYKLTHNASLLGKDGTILFCWPLDVVCLREQLDEAHPEEGCTRLRWLSRQIEVKGRECLIDREVSRSQKDLQHISSHVQD